MDAFQLVTAALLLPEGQERNDYLLKLVVMGEQKNQQAAAVEVVRLHLLVVKVVRFLQVTEDLLMFSPTWLPKSPVPCSLLN
jgi:hypothetical protein